VYRLQQLLLLLYVCVDVYAAFQVNKVVYINKRKIKRLTVSPVGDAILWLTYPAWCRFIVTFTGLVTLTVYQTRPILHEQLTQTTVTLHVNYYQSVTLQTR